MTGQQLRISCLLQQPPALLCKTKRHYLITCNINKYCLLTLHGQKRQMSSPGRRPTNRDLGRSKLFGNTLDPRQNARAISTDKQGHLLNDHQSGETITRPLYLLKSFDFCFACLSLYYTFTWRFTPVIIILSFGVKWITLEFLGSAITW